MVRITTRTLYIVHWSYFGKQLYEDGDKCVLGWLFKLPSDDEVHILVADCSVQLITEFPVTALSCPWYQQVSVGCKAESSTCSDSVICRDCYGIRDSCNSLITL